MYEVNTLYLILYRLMRTNLRENNKNNNIKYND